MISRCLTRLLPHLDLDEVALTGGVAIGLHAPERRRERVNDLDFVARRMSAVAPSVARDFLVSHHHVARPEVPKAILQLVDPDTRIRIDLFPDLNDAMRDAAWAELNGIHVRVLSARAILDHKLGLLGDRRVEEKHWLDARALASACAAPPPARPDMFHHAEYCRDPELVCERCELSRDPAFPLAPKRAILGLLGYV
jgi:hypothetical protein